MHPTLIAGYVALFVALGAAFLCVNLLVGWLVRPREPNREKLEVYECGEPAIGSSFVQFDLRFYVVALLFIIFDVEVALFFPWATVFGKAVELTDPALVAVQADGKILIGGLFTSVNGSAVNATTGVNRVPGASFDAKLRPGEVVVEPEFDADAAFASYMRKREAGVVGDVMVDPADRGPVAPGSPRPASFGRKTI